MRLGELASLLRLHRTSPAGGERRLRRAHSIEDLADAARGRLPRAALAYLEGGGESEWTLRRNRRAFAKAELVPHALRDVSDVDVSTTILGREVAAPLVLAPVGAPRFIQHEGELASVRAAASAGIPFAVSTVGSCSVEEVAREAPATCWLQLYVWGDRGAAGDLLDRAEGIGYHAVVLTVDVAVRSKRERELRAGLSLPTPRPSVATLADAARHPRWAWHLATSPLPAFPNVGKGDGADPRSTWDLDPLFDGTVSWADLEWLRDRWPGPVIVKGILRPDDARRAADAGADAVVVSNHGGRQLDHLPATVDVVADVADAVGDGMEVLLDSGIRRGTDVLVALGRGARAVLVGRAYLYGLAVAGEPGVRRAIDILVDELRRAMALTGARCLGEVDGSLLRSRSPAGSSFSRAG